MSFRISFCVFAFVRLCVSLFIVVNCSDPGIPANSIRQSKIEHGNFTFGTVVFYDCNPGYYLFGSPVLTCQPTGQWDKPLPECIGQFDLKVNETNSRVAAHVLAAVNVIQRMP